jgi:hypothetical protein
MAKPKDFQSPLKSFVVLNRRRRGLSQYNEFFHRGVTLSDKLKRRK